MKNSRRRDNPIKSYSFPGILLLSLLGVIHLGGCGDVTGKKQVSSSEESKGSTLYVANAGDGSLLAFDPPPNKATNFISVLPQGNVSPSRRFPEGIAGPAGLFLDRSSDTLYVANAGQNAILIYEKASTFKPTLGSAAARRVISGPQTGLNHPYGIAYDAVKCALYVANKENSIVVFQADCSQTDQLDGNIPPTRVLKGEKTFLDFPRAIAVDARRDILYISNMGTSSILVYDQASRWGDTPAKCFDPKTGNPALCDIAPTRLIAPHILISGTINVTTGSKTVTGNETFFTKELRPGDRIQIGKEALTVASIESDTSLTLTTLYPDRSDTRLRAFLLSDEKITSALELPFGLFIDSASDRLYAVKAGGNQPAIFIYETASLKGDTPAACTSAPFLCNIPPERLLTTRFSDLPPECTAFPPAPECATTQLTNPAGIDVDVARSRIYVVNNNNTNNVNLSGGKNTSSTALLVFNLKDADNNDRCPVATQLCNIPPDWRIGGDVTGDNETTLTNPVGVAVDAEKDLIYLSNPTANNILVFSLEGNIAPVKVNSGTTNSGGKTRLEQPISFFYDSAMDRLYVANFNSTSVAPNTPNITVYDNVSSRFFLNSPPSWTITAPTSDVQLPRGVYLDRTRRLLIILSGNILTPKLQIYSIDAISGFPLDSDPTATAITLPSSLPLTPSSPITFTQGLHRSRAMAVDEGRGFVYIVNDCDANDQTRCASLQPNGNKIVVYDLNNLSLTAPVRTISGLNRPFGISIDTTRDILYVTTGSIGANLNSILAFKDASSPTTNGNIAPNRVISSSADATAADILSTPTAPFVNTAADRLFLINRGNNSIYIYDNASTRNGALEPDRKIAGDATLLSFSGDGTDVTGALLVDTSRGKETLFVGQPKDPECPACPNLRGVFLIFSVEGNIAPGRIWSGGGAPLAGPSATVLDGDVLYVANQGNPGITADDSISIFTTASQVQGDAISPQSVTNRLNNPAGLALDSARRRLYVSNGGTTDCTPAAPCNSILVFNTDDFGSSQPTISSSALNAPRGLALDAGRKILYVANSGARSVLIFENVDTLNGVVEPDIELTGFQNPIAVAVDSNRDLLYVLDEETKEIAVIEAASSENETVTGRVITGDFITAPSSLFLDPQNDLLYVADQGANRVYIFTGASSAEGEANHTTLSGDNTGLNQPVALAVESADSLGAP